MTMQKHFHRVIAVLLVLTFAFMLTPLANVFAAPSYKFGSSNTELQPGTYDLPLAMMKTDKQSSSMASSCIKGGKLTVNSDGTADVIVELGSVTMGAITAYAKDWQVYQDDSYESGAKVPAEEMMDSNGNVVEIKFRVPDNTRDGVFVNMNISIAGGNMNQNAYFKMNYDQISGQSSAVDGESAATENTDAESSASKDESADNNHSIGDIFRNLIPSNGESSKTFSFGSAGTKLDAGTYTVPVSLMKVNDHTSESMAKDTFPATVTLEVSDDGTATIISTVQSVTFGTLKDMAKDIKIYQSDSPDGDAVPVNVLETTQLDESFAKGPKEVPSKISFQIPNNSWDGVYINFFVDAMGAAPNAWLKIDYANAQKQGNTTTEPTDSAKDSGTYIGKAHVEQFGEYDIHTTVTVKDGKIETVKVSSENFSGNYAETNRSKIAAASSGMEHKWDGMNASQANAENIYNVAETDAVSGATYSSKAIRDAVMDALKVSYTPAQAPVPEALLPGTYEVNVSYYTDVVKHYLTGQETSKATITVQKNGSAVIDIDIVNGTKSEPLYVLALNGYYPNNDLSQTLSMDGASYTTEKCSYSDTYFGEGTPVVNHVTIPLTGLPAQEYATSMKLYVPVMNALNGEQGGITFENGKFDCNAFIKIDWSPITGSVSSSNDSKFKDVKGHWATSYINDVTEKGYFGGISDTEFAPERPITRGEFVTVLGGLVNGKGENSDFMIDLYPFKYSTQYILWAIQNGIAAGTSVDTFDPNRVITREEMAVMLRNFVEYEGQDLKTSKPRSFTDESMISDWAKESVNLISSATLMVGMGDGTFSPKSSTTRAQAAVIISNLMKDYSF